jgi:hypothetical protein
MGFVHGYLLAGLVMVSLPVLFHLLMRQKPKRIKFPAIQFLIQKQNKNQRRMNIQHWLLLLLRMLVVALVCLALSRPRITMGDFSFGRDQQIAAVMIFDTTPSMDYKIGDKTRLDEARFQAGKFLDEISPESKIAIIDLSSSRENASPGTQEWLPGRRQIEQKLAELKTHAAGASLASQVNFACKLLKTLGDGEGVPPKFIFIFSDRTAQSWTGMDGTSVSIPKDVSTVYFDVGEDNPAELAIDNMVVEPVVAEPGGVINVRLVLRSTGMDHKALVNCSIDNLPGDLKIADKKSYLCPKGVSTEANFELPVPKLEKLEVGPQYFQLVAKLASTDAWDANDKRFATFQVRPKSSILILAEDAKTPRIMRAALDALGSFKSETRILQGAAPLKLDDLSTFKTVVLFQVNKLEPALVQKLMAYVKSGGGLAVVPGPSLNPESYGTAEARDLLPLNYASFERIPAGKPGYWLGGFDGANGLTAPFKDWIASADPDFNRPELRPIVVGRWKVQPLQDASVLASYIIDGGLADAAIVEKSVGAGKVVGFTTPLDGGNMEGNRRYNNYWQDSSFGLILVDRTAKYLAGEARLPELDFISGQPVVIPISTALLKSPLQLRGPGLSPAESTINLGENRETLVLRQPVEPGNYQLLDNKERQLCAFSVNLPTEESYLEKIAIEKVEELLGKGSVVPLGKDADLTERIRQNYRPPLELMPWLLLLLPLVMAMESLTANKFYKKDPQPA